MAQKLQKPDYLYRKGVGIMVINYDNKIFVGKRIDTKGNAWQMPQGGIDIGEDEDVAAMRELQEETGIASVDIIAKSESYYYYDLPYFLQKKFWNGQYLGQKQRWYLMRFTGSDADINLSSTAPAEFSEWKWVGMDEIIQYIVEFKRDLYKEIIRDFSKYLR